MQVVAAADRAAAEFAESHRLRQVRSVERGALTWARRSDAALLAGASGSPTLADLRAIWQSLQA